jgi:transcriptional antiterminator Rof (Rho-off)
VGEVSVVQATITSRCQLASLIHAIELELQLSNQVDGCASTWANTSKQEFVSARGEEANAEIFHRYYR